MGNEWLSVPFVVAVVGVPFVVDLQFCIFKAQSKRHLAELVFNEKVARLEFIMFLRLAGGLSESQKYILDHKRK